MTIMTATYEPREEAIALFESHSSAIRAHKERCWDFVLSVGAVGYRPHRYEPMASLLFIGPKAPMGYRKIRSSAENIECVPSQNTKAGKAVAMAIRELGRPPHDSDLAENFGWETSSFVMDDRSIYWPSFLEIGSPDKRYFLRLPRQQGDGWIMPDSLKAIPESELMEAIETHNAEWRQRKDSAAQKGE